MSRNVTILVIVLVILLIAGYLVWLRGRFQTAQVPVVVPTPQVAVSSPTPTLAASPSATPKVATPSGIRSRVSPTPKVSPTGATASGRTVR